MIRVDAPVKLTDRLGIGDEINNIHGPSRCMTKHPIGIIDSGIGGLTVWQELVAIMPDETYFYFGDSGFCPYGLKTAREITDRVERIVDFLIENGCKIIVIACNAITAASIDFLRSHYTIPFVGMEPAIKPAMMRTRTGAVGVLATSRTLRGELFQRTKATYGKGITIIEQVGHGLVERVEALDFNSESTLAHLTLLLQPMLAWKIDILVLGCTHYPFLQAAIQQITGNRVTILNPAPAVARQTVKVVERLQRAPGRETQATNSVFHTTGNSTIMKAILDRINPSRFDIKSVVI